MIGGITSHVASMLRSLGIRHVVAGGVAVIYYGVPRFTYDVDFLVPKLNKLKANEFVASAKKVGFKFDESEAQQVLVRGGFFRMEGFKDFVEGFTVDVIVYPNLEQILKRSNYIKSIRVRMISPEDLIVQKLLLIKKLPSKRPRLDKDREDVVTLLAAQQDRLNMRFLREEAAKQGVSSLLKNFLKKVSRY